LSNKPQKHTKTQKEYRLLTTQEIFREIYSFHGANEAGKRTKINTVR